MFETKLTRRQTMGALAASAAMPLLASCRNATSDGAAGNALAVLDGFANHFLTLSPESATSLGVDTGARAGLRTKLQDRSAAGMQRVMSMVRADLDRAKAFDASHLDFELRTNFEVVLSAYKTALEGFAFPYGDIPVVGDNSWRNAPYVVIQNVGAWLDVPQLLNNDQPLETKEDAEAYLARLAEFPKVLDGELGRLESARGMGLVPPSFLIDKTIPPLTLAAKDAASGGAMVDTLVKKT